jgi:hypothetical protein
LRGRGELKQQFKIVSGRVEIKPRKPLTPYTG